MADFMTVLAASQKQGSPAIQGNVLAALLPGDQFDSVLSMQLTVAADAQTQLQAQVQANTLPLPQALPQPQQLPLPQALNEAFTLQAKPAGTKKSSTPTTADSDPTVAATLALAALVLPREATGGNGATIPDVAEPAAKPVTASLPQSLDMAATHAAVTPDAGQELPPNGVPAPVADATLAAAEKLLTKTSSDTPPQKHQGNDLPDGAAVRQLGQFQSVARAPDVNVQATVAAPVRSQAFAAELSDKIVWMAGNGTHSADLSLNPPQLGQLQVRLSLSGSEAGAQFFSPHPAVRDAIEAALPRLRELMAQAGIALGDTQVRQEAFSRNDSGSNAGNGSGKSSGGDSSATRMAIHASIGGVTTRSGLGLVDLYV